MERMSNEVQVELERADKIEALAAILTVRAAD